MSNEEKIEKGDRRPGSSKAKPLSKVASPLSPSKIVKPVVSGEEILEQLAELEHIQWAHWMEYLQSKRYHHFDPQPAFHSEDWEHWMKQVATPYTKLSEKEKESERE